MEAKDVIKILGLFEKEGVGVWLDGGWNVDALLQEQTRPHKDVDIVIQVENAQKMQDVLRHQGFILIKGESPTDFVLRDKEGGEIDVHPVTFDEHGNGIYRMENGEDWIYPAEGFTGKGKINGYEVHCLSAKTAMLCHTGYQAKKKDFQEMKALHERFGVDYPDEYRNRF